MPDELDPALIGKLAAAIGIAGRPRTVQRLREQLPAVADNAELLRSYESHRVVPSSLIKQLEGLRRPLLAVLDAFGIDLATGWDPARQSDLYIRVLNAHLVGGVHRENIHRLEQEEREHEHLAAHLQGVLTLHRAASLAIKRVSQDKQDGHGGDRHRPDVAKRNIAFHLILVYESVTGRKAGRSLDPVTGKATGPWSAFSCSP